MRTLSCLAIAAALWVPMAAWAQDTPTVSTDNTETEEVATPPRIIPKVEFSFGGGAGIGGYLASFPTDPWLMHVGQSDNMQQDYLKFYPPKASLMPAGHAGFFVDFNFTEHWGLITGAELGLYFSRVSSDMLLNVTTNVVTGSGSAGCWTPTGSGKPPGAATAKRSGSCWAAFWLPTRAGAWQSSSAS